MGHTINYEGKPDREAVRDLVRYVGFRGSRLLYRTAKACDKVEQFAFYCSLAGVQGFPVRAAWQRWRNA